MAEIPDKIKNIVHMFIQELEKNNIHIKQAILFGSYASGRYNDWSDIDIALVSDSFTGHRFFDRNKLRTIKLAISSAIEPLPFTPNEFNSDNPFVKRILDTGLRLI